MRALSATDPATIGPYRLIGVLGSGGMGRVYLGQSPAGRQLAIKVLRSDLAEDQAYLRRFTREAAVARSVSPLFTAPLVDADPTADPPWFATVYIDGPSLQRWVDRRGPMTAGTVLTLAAGLAEALASMHRVGLVHRDLKPSNVLLNDAGPHIIDFGVALVPDASRMTDSMMVGTPSYMAPERIQGTDADAAADIFSLGATLAFAATGKSLVSQGTVYEQIVQITAGRFDLSSIPAALRPLVVRCVSQRPKDRPTAEEIARILVGSGIAPPAAGWLERVATDVPKAVTDHFDTVTAAPRMSRRQLLAVGSLVGVAVAGGAVGLAVGMLGRAPQRAQAGGAPSASPDPAPTSGAPLAGPTASARFPWFARTGLVGRPTDPYAERVVIDAGERLITSAGSVVTATDPGGRLLWQRQLPATALRQRRWADSVLVNDDQRVWLLQCDTGVIQFVRNLVAEEAPLAAPSNPDHTPIQINRILIAADRAFLDLGTATIAIDQSGAPIWRAGRRVVGGVRSTSDTPQAASPAWLSTRSSSDLGERVTLYHTGSGKLSWSVHDPLVMSGTSVAGGGGRLLGAPTPSGPPPAGGPPPGAPPPPGGQPGAGPGDLAWSLSEGRFVGPYAVLRDGQQIEVRRMSDGSLFWQRFWPSQVVALEITPDTLLVAADQLYALNLADGSQRWVAGLQGARIALTLDGTGVLAATAMNVALINLDRAGSIRWQAAVPAGITGGAMPDRLSVDASQGYLTYQPTGDTLVALPIDVMAIALATQPT